MRVTIANKLFVEDATRECINWCEENLVLPNLEYHKKEQMGKWVGNTPKTISLYERAGLNAYLPFGCYAEFFRAFPGTPYRVVFEPIRHFMYNSSIKPYEYQEEAVRLILERKNGVIVAGCGGGKGLPLNAKIYTPNGWIRNGDLKIGDEIIGSNGKAIKVTGIFDKGEVEAYKIVFSDETEIVCDKDHLWTVQKQTQRGKGKNKWWVENTENIYKAYTNIKRQDLLYIPVVKPVHFNQKQITLDPWLLGFLIGDGCFRNGSVTFTTQEKDIIERITKIVNKKYNGAESIRKICENVNNYDYTFVGANILNSIRGLDLYEKYSFEKHIPEQYKYNTIKIRLSVLQGLFDADGYVPGKGIYEYSTSSKKLADDIIEIIQSLGGSAKVREKTPTYTHNGEKRIGKTSYRIFFKLYDFKPFTSDKHKERYYKRTKYDEPYKIIKKVIPCGKITSRCITVNAEDELYVTDHFTVTHNTQIGMEAIARIGGRALWLTHTQDLLNQSMERAKAVFGIPQNSYGTITAGKVNVSNGLTFATVQTLSNIDLTEYRSFWDVIVVDEVQHAAGGPTKVTQFYKVLSNLSARYKIGLTATPKRADGLERSMFALLGGVIKEITREEVENTTCPIKVNTISTGYMPDYNIVLMGDGTIDYMRLVEALVNDKERFDLVVKVAESTDGPTIVLGNRVEYLKNLNEACSKRSVCLSAMGQSKSAKQVRRESLQKLNDGELDVIFATYQLAAEGLDVPNLRYVVFATPEKDPSRVQQAAGRVGRIAEGKEYGAVIDLVDNFGMYKGWYRKRKNVYKKLNCEILEYEEIIC